MNNTVTSAHAPAMPGAVMEVAHGPYAYGVPSDALSALTLVGHTGDMSAEWGNWHERYVVSLPPRLRTVTPDESRPAHVLRVRRWSANGPLQGTTTAHLVPAKYNPATAQYELQPGVAAGGHAARFVDIEVRQFIESLTGLSLDSVNIHDYDLYKEAQNNVG
jgi:hypothetical protein